MYAHTGTNKSYKRLRSTAFDQSFCKSPPFPFITMPKAMKAMKHTNKAASPARAMKAMKAMKKTKKAAAPAREMNAKKKDLFLFCV